MGDRKTLLTFQKRTKDNLSKNGHPRPQCVLMVVQLLLFQMYMGGKLVFADYVFNGYSTTKRDFMKQVHCIYYGFDIADPYHTIILPKGGDLHPARKARTISSVRLQVHQTHRNQDPWLQRVGLSSLGLHAGPDTILAAVWFPFHLQEHHPRSTCGEEYTNHCDRV